MEKCFCVFLPNDMQHNNILYLIETGCGDDGVGPRSNDEAQTVLDACACGLCFRRDKFLVILSTGVGELTARFIGRLMTLILRYVEHWRGIPSKRAQFLEVFFLRAEIPDLHRTRARLYISPRR